ncbi:MAG: AAA family ATPase, partial [Burkholderiaceae bacterium]|nr:AAA family ATPase [Burkholderiaceae bacterium]
KDAAKQQLDILMVGLLTDFQSIINGWLVQFGAPFQLKELKHTYAGGGGVRSQYVIEVRGAEVAVGPTAPGELTFHSALSEGDKRTLAFAFFLAKIFKDPNRAHATVVLDDVFTSLDHHRRHNTINAAVQVANECAQVIALGHDAHFLRELRKRSENKKVGDTLELFLQRDAHNYSLLANFDLDEFCASDYYKHYVLVEQFIIGSLLPNQFLNVAIALRPLVEGHLHKSFPKRFKEGQTVGQMLDVVKNATGNNPLVGLQLLLDEFTTFNDYAAAYHHDTSGSHPRVDTNETELLHFAKGAMRFIQLRSFT